MKTISKKQSLLISLFIGGLVTYLSYSKQELKKKNLSTISKKKTISQKSMVTKLRPSSITLSQKLDVEMDAEDIIESHHQNALSKLKADSDHAQWQEFYRDWFLRLNDFLIDQGFSPYESARKIKAYIELKDGFANDQKYEALQDELDVVSKNYLNAMEDSSFTPKEKQEFWEKKYHKLVLEIRTVEKDYEKRMKDFWGDQFEEVNNELESYNDELSQRNAHLGYNIGIPL